MVDETTGMEMFSEEAEANKQLQEFDQMWSKVERRQDLRKFFLVVFSAILAICYGAGMFFAGRATEPTPDPEVYVINESEASTTTVP